MSEVENNIKKLYRALIADEPPGLKGYVFVPKENQRYFKGTTIPVISTPLKKIDISNKPLIIPSSVSINKQPIDYLNTYVILEEYFLPLKEAVPKNVQIKTIIDSLLEEHTMKEYLLSLSILNHICQNQKYMQDFGKFYIGMLTKKEAKDKLKTLLNHGNCQLLARQSILLAMRSVLLHHKTKNPKSRINSLASATILTHAISSNAYRENKDEKTFEGTDASESLALEFIQNYIFNESKDVLASLDATLRLWEEYGNQTSINRLRKPATDLFFEATGISLRDFIALGFEVYSVQSTWSPDKQIKLLNIGGMGGMEKATIDAFLKQVASTPEQLKKSLENRTKSWDLLAFQEKPVIILEDKLLTIDQSLLIQRLTSGAYWIVHDYEKQLGGNKNLRWAEGYGKMVELMVEDELQRRSLPLLDDSQSFFTEEDFKKAYPKSKCSDAGLDYHNVFCLFEIVSAQTTIKTRIEGNPEAFYFDTEKIVLKKVRQLDETSKNLIQNFSKLSDDSKRQIRSIIPVVVTPGGYPVNPLTMSYIKEKMKKEKLLADRKIQPLSIIDLEELFMLGSLSETKITIPDVLKDWKKSTLKEMPLKNYLLAKYSHHEFRQKSLGERTDKMFKDIINRIKL